MSASRLEDVHSDEPWLSVRWNHRHKCVYAEFKSFATSSEFRISTLKIIDAVRGWSASSLVSDNRLAKALSGWKPVVALDDGLARCVEFVRSHASAYRPREYQQ